MTDLRQAAQQALEALEAITRSVQSDHQAEIAEDAITTLREALAQEHALHELARLGQEIEQAEPVQEQKYEKRIAPYSTTLSMLLNTTPPQQQAEPVQENKTLIEWKERGEAIMAQAGVGFRLGAWWADRPWRQK